MVRMVWEGGSTHKLPLNRLRTRPGETRWPNRIPGRHHMILPREMRRSDTRRTGHRDDPRATLWPHVQNSSGIFGIRYMSARVNRKKEKEKERERERERKSIANRLSTAYSSKKPRLCNFQSSSISCKNFFY